jgi:hypothetical protein
MESKNSLESGKEEFLKGRGVTLLKQNEFFRLIRSQTFQSLGIEA